MQRPGPRNQHHQQLHGLRIGQVYRAASALLAASEGEGFGLPLIEAAQYGLPIIARDIAIFREVAGEHAYYFRAKDAQGLADALRTWMHLGDALPPSAGIPRLTWRQSSRQLLDIVIGNGWYRSCSLQPVSIAAIQAV
jgi:glycosyltransferase involved in cell wall biosynthesis